MSWHQPSGSLIPELYRHRVRPEHRVELLHLFLEAVQHRQADVRLIEDQDGRRLQSPLAATICPRNWATVDESNKLVWPACRSAAVQAEGQNRILSGQ